MQPRGDGWTGLSVRSIRKPGCGGFDPRDIPHFGRIRTMDKGTVIVKGKRALPLKTILQDLEGLPVTDFDYALVTVRTRMETDKPSSGLSAFLVDLTSAAYITISQTMGYRVAW